jgi:hypothetical protein
MDPTETDCTARSARDEVQYTSDAHTSVSLDAGSLPTVHEGPLGATRNADGATESGKRLDLGLTAESQAATTNHQAGNPPMSRVAASGIGRPDTRPFR